PEPEPPRRQSVSPRETWRSIPRRTSRPLNRLVTCSRSITVSPATQEAWLSSRRDPERTPWAEAERCGMARGEGQVARSRMDPRASTRPVRRIDTAIVARRRFVTFARRTGKKSAPSPGASFYLAQKHARAPSPSRVAKAAMGIHKILGGAPVKFDTIAIALDFSDGSRGALETARRLAQPGTSLKLIHVVDSALFHRGPTYGDAHVAEHVYQDLIRGALAQLDVLAEELRVERFRVTCAAVVGRPADAIVASAENADV